MDKQKNVYFIDFEYSQYNLRGFDIGNYLNETQFDYTIAEYPYFAVFENEIGDE